MPTSAEITSTIYSSYGSLSAGDNRLRPSKYRIYGGRLYFGGQISV
jgi:hypothetical protein